MTKMAKSAPNIRKITFTCLVILSLSAQVICDEIHQESPTIDPEEVNLEGSSSRTTTEDSILVENAKEINYLHAVPSVDSTSISKQGENESDVNRSNQSNLHTTLEVFTKPNPMVTESADANSATPTQVTLGMEEKESIIGKNNILLKQDTGDISITTEDVPDSSSINPESFAIPDNVYISEDTKEQPPKNVSKKNLKDMSVPEPVGLLLPTEESLEDTSNTSSSSLSLIPDLNSGENQSDIIQDRIDIEPETQTETETNAEDQETLISYVDETELTSVSTSVDASNNKKPLSEEPRLSNYSDSEEEIITHDIEATESPETVETETTDSKESEFFSEGITSANPMGLEIENKTEKKTNSASEASQSKSSLNVTIGDSVVVIDGRNGAEIFDLEPLPDGSRANKAGKGLTMPKTPTNRKIENLAEEKVNSENMTSAFKLKSWLQDPYLRAPVALLVPLRPKALNRALGVWRELVNTSVNLTDLILIGYDDMGIGWLSRHSLQRGSNIAGSNSGASSVTASLVKLLQKQMQNRGNALPTPTAKPTEGVLHACARAARLVPYDSAVFVLADEAAQATDATFTERAARVLLAKRLKLYTIWMAPNSQTKQPNDASSILRTVSRETDGDFVPFYPAIEEINIESESSNQSLEVEKIWGSSKPSSAGAEDRQMRSNYVLHTYTAGHFQEQGIRVMDQTLIYRKGGGGHATLGVPVDGGIRELRLRIEGTLERAALYPPTGPQIDLFNASSVQQFHPGSILISNSPLEVLLKLPSTYDADNMYSVLPASSAQKEPSLTRSQQDGGEGARGRGPLSGVWRLSVRCAECRYRVLVRARAALGFDATLIGDKMIRLRVHGPVATVRETSLVDDRGTEIAKLPFRHQPVAGEEAPSSDNKLEEELKNTVLVADVPVQTLNPNITIYAQAVGRDIYGESFIRMSGPITSIQDAAGMEIPKGRSAAKTVRSAAVVFSGNEKDVENPDVELIEDNQSEQPVMSRNINASTFATQILTSSGEVLTGVQIGLSSRLYGAPGEILQLHFEVTNYRDQSVYFRFGATGSLNFLRSISPQWQWVNSGQTVNVIVTAGITSNAEIGARDTIVFTATGVDQVTLSSYIYVVSSSIVTALDSWPPTMTHTFQGDCLGKQGSDCASNIWSATVTARDQDGGLLRISSSPAGLRYGSGFISGTREEVTATYRATCCATRVVLSASDLYGNVNAYTVDISGYLTPATIAAITLGVFLIIAIILILIFLIWFCVRKRQESRELSYPTARRDT